MNKFDENEVKKKKTKKQKFSINKKKNKAFSKKPLRAILFKIKIYKRLILWYSSIKFNSY